MRYIKRILSMAVIMIVTLTVSLSAYALTTQEKINQKEQEKKQTQQNLEEMTAFAKAFAEKTGAVIAVTGAIDIVADSRTAYRIRNGHPMMSAVTGTGCQLSALTAAYVAANPNHPLEAAAAAVCAMGLAGEIAFGRLSGQDGNGTYRNYLIDAIYRMTPQTLEKGADYEVR